MRKNLAPTLLERSAQDAAGPHIHSGMFYERNSMGLKA